MRINKFLAGCGVASRRTSDSLILNGRVKINGKPAALGAEVQAGDIVTVDGKRVNYSQNVVYLMLNKPAGYVTTVKDPQGRNTVMELLPKTGERLFPVGRLDYDTSGLLLFTNDGELANKLMHPRYEHNKTYLATVSGELSEAKLNKLRSGVDIGEGYKTAKALVKVIKTGITALSEIEIVIHEGKNRQVRRMFEAVGLKVAELKRTKIGGVKLGNLPPGETRILTNDEISLLKKA